jgi:tetratricopeptide (TPR) repeat protein
MKNTSFPQQERGFIAIKTRAFGLRLAVLMSAAMLVACAATTPGGPAGEAAKQPVPPAVRSAQQLEQRAAQAFTRSEWADAQADYQTASGIYASLAMTDAQLRAQLSVARVQAESGQSAPALQTIEAVLKRVDSAQVQDSTRLIAHGRAAALLMVTDPANAQQHWQQARDLCAAQCAQLASLWVLQARMALQRGDAAAGLAAANAALQAKPTSVERANALRVRVTAALQLHQLAGAEADGQAALHIDQSLGLSTRVIEDLRVLVAVYRAQGNAAQAAHHQGLLTQAEAARRALQGDAPIPAAGSI